MLLSIPNFVGDKCTQSAMTEAVRGHKQIVLWIQRNMTTLEESLLVV